MDEATPEFPPQPQSWPANNAVPLSHDQRICVRVRQNLLQLGSAELSPPIHPVFGTFCNNGHLYLLDGALTEMQHFAGSTADWLIKVAHYICSPRQAGCIYTHTTGTPDEWYHKDRGDDWREVFPDDPLLPGIYEFVADKPFVLSRLSQGVSKSSRTSATSKPKATMFLDQVTQRDGLCAITRASTAALVASHLIPKRLGTEGAKSITQTFVGEEAAAELHPFHPMTGVLLISMLHTCVHLFELGFYHVADNTYVLHNFSVCFPDLSIVGLSSLSYPLPPLHGHRVTLASRDKNVPLPPPGIFQWHYLQCVVKRFATQEFKDFPGIYYHVFPFKTEDDESDDDDGRDFWDYEGNDPPYPTYFFDKFMVQQARKEEECERNQEVARWSADVASSTFDNHDARGAGASSLPDLKINDGSGEGFELEEDDNFDSGLT